MMTFLTHPAVLLTLGGAAGTNARYYLSLWIHDQRWTTHFPLATFLINVSGSLVLGLCLIPFHNRLPAGWILLGIGFCGGYTTFSTFALETVTLLRSGHRTDVAIGYVLSSVLASCIVCWLAVASMESVYPRTPEVIDPTRVMEAGDSPEQKAP